MLIIHNNNEFHYGIFIQVCNVFLAHPHPTTVALPCSSPTPTDPLSLPTLFLFSCLGFDDPMGFIRIALRAWIRDYFQEHGLPTSHNTIKENVSHSPSDHKLPVEHSEGWDLVRGGTLMSPSPCLPLSAYGWGGNSCLLPQQDRVWEVQPCTDLVQRV